MTLRQGGSFIGAIDQGTTSTRFFLFNRDSKAIASHQLEHTQILPRPGWVEHDPSEIWARTDQTIRGAIDEAGIDGGQIAAIGITNQRETVVVWDRHSGAPLCNAIVWNDTRTAALIERFAFARETIQTRTGLPLATYFSALKLRWLIDHEPKVAEGIEAGTALFGTVDSWLLWNLTGVHATDVTNASRTLLMDLESLTWSDELLDIFGVPRSILPAIVPSISSNQLGLTRKDGPVGAEVPIHAILGDQQAALFGQACFEAGCSKNTYGTGCFLLMNTGTDIVRSRHGLLTTVAYRRDTDAARYALEGSVAVAGSLVQWLRDSLHLIERSSDVDSLAAEVEDSGGIYFVPAFSGLFAPHWRPDARGVITGLTSYTNAAHIARAVLEATAFQTFDIVEAMRTDADSTIEALRVDGGMAVSDILMQFQADLLDIPVIRTGITETTALGAAYAAGMGSGTWGTKDSIAAEWIEERRWEASITPADRADRLRFWRKAVDRSLGWAEE